VLTEKKTTTKIIDGAENNTVVATAGSNKTKAHIMRDKQVHN